MAGFLSLPLELRCIIWDFLVDEREGSIQAFDVVVDPSTTPDSPAKLVLSSQPDASIWKPATKPSAILTTDTARLFGARFTSDKWVFITAYPSAEAATPTEYLIQRSEDIVYLHYDQDNYELMSRQLPWHQPRAEPSTTSRHGPERVALHPSDLYLGARLDIRSRFRRYYDQHRPLPSLPDRATRWNPHLEALIQGLVESGTRSLYLVGPASNRSTPKHPPARGRQHLRAPDSRCESRLTWPATPGTFASYPDWDVSEAWPDEVDRTLDCGVKMKLEYKLRPLTLRRLALEHAD